MLAYVYLPSSFAEFTNIAEGLATADGDPRFIASAAVVIGIVMSAGILALTGYYTGTEYRPVKDVGKTSLTGAATVILSGPLGRLRVRGLHHPGHRRRRLRCLPARWRGAHGVAVRRRAGRLRPARPPSASSSRWTPSARSPTTPRASRRCPGDVSPEGAQILTELDAVGNTTKAITKGIAIATAVLAATALFGSYATSVFEALVDANSAPDEFLLDFERLQPGRPRRRAARRGRGVPLLGPRHQRGRPRCRRGGLRGAPPVPRDPRDHGGHRSPGVRQGRRHRHQGLAARARDARHPGRAGAHRRRLRSRRRPRWPGSWPAPSAPAP